jgi:uncharacterized protein YgiM (DUF1202 family)
MRLIAVLIAAALSAAAATFTVTVEEAKVRKRKQHFAPVVASVRYGDKIKAGDSEDGWYRVTAGGASGYLHESALGTKLAQAKAGKWEGGASASADEVTLAGKGFNENVEKAYRGRHADLDFAGVDAMQKRKLTDEALTKFMESGGTLPRGAK